jgi:hypothetical protein
MWQNGFCERRFPGSLLPVLAVLALLTASAAAGQPTENCTGAGLTGASTLPWNGSFTPNSFEFSLSGSGCFTPPFGVDSVVCFVPSGSCSVDVQCAFPSSQRVELNVRDMGAGGACTASPGPCVAGTGVDAGGGNNATSPLTLSGVSLVAGNNYCFICSTSDQAPLIQQTISITGSGCGALPVTLQSFDIAGAASPSPKMQADRGPSGDVDAASSSAP